jgi:hypothetical protein
MATPEFVGGDCAWGTRRTGNSFLQSDDAVLYHLAFADGQWFVDAAVGGQATLPQFRQMIFEITCKRFDHLGGHFTPTVVIEQTYLEDVKVPLSEKYPGLKWNFVGVPVDTTPGAKVKRIADMVRAIQTGVPFRLNIEKLPPAVKAKLRSQLDGENYKDVAGHDDWGDALSLCYVAIRDELIEYDPRANRVPPPWEPSGGGNDNDPGGTGFAF